jgi:ABC-type uncharacterized transport system permease subunit
MIEVAAVQKRINESLVSNYGYAGILVAFVSRHNPLATILVAVLLGGILASGGILQRSHDLPDATVLVFQGIVFLCAFCLVIRSTVAYLGFKKSPSFEASDFPLADVNQP